MSGCTPSRQVLALATEQGNVYAYLLNCVSHRGTVVLQQTLCNGFAKCLFIQCWKTPLYKMCPADVNTS
jgi:hypothetical protein